MLKSKILLIDDDPEEFGIFCRAFANIAERTLCIQALNCQDAFHELDSSIELPKYIFLDLNLPGSDGKYCLQHLKNHPKYYSVPVFIYTTSKWQLDLEETKKLGAQMFFTKPNNLHELNKILTFVISEQWKSN